MQVNILNTEMLYISEYRIFYYDGIYITDG